MTKPDWLKKRVAYGTTMQNVLAVLRSGCLHTVCEEARCPNCPDCFSRGTATFLILGDRCTRDCRFCAVTHEAPLPPDHREPGNIAEAVGNLGLHYTVITSVTRDDLPDGGAAHFAETIECIRSVSPGASIEVLIPDFGGSEKALETVIAAKPDVIGHNLETAPRLYPVVRPQADYQTSLTLLKAAAAMNPSIPTKSGLMLGIGEHPDEIRQVLHDLREAGCSLLWLGQYLQPDRTRLPVERYVHPNEFEAWREEASALGFRGVASGPFVRSSYHAGELYESLHQTAI